MTVSYFNIERVNYLNIKSGKGSDGFTKCASSIVQKNQWKHVESYQRYPRLSLAAIPRPMHRVSSDLRSCAAQGPVSTGVGGTSGKTAGCCQLSIPGAL